MQWRERFEEGTFFLGKRSTLVRKTVSANPAFGNVVGRWVMKRQFLRSMVLSIYLVSLRSSFLLLSSNNRELCTDALLPLAIDYRIRTIHRSGFFLRRQRERKEEEKTRR